MGSCCPPPPLFWDFSGSLHVLPGRGPAEKVGAASQLVVGGIVGLRRGGESVQLGARGRWPNGGEGGMNSRASGH